MLIFFADVGSIYTTLCIDDHLNESYKMTGSDHENGIEVAGIEGITTSYSCARHFIHLAFP